MRYARTGVVVCAMLASGVVSLAAPPYQPDQETMLLMHLDGDVSEAAQRIPGAEAKGELKWIDGAFGKAVALDGSNGVQVTDNGMLNIRDSSWTLEAWIKPEAEQPQDAYVIGSFPGLGRTYSLRLLGGKRLAARFGADDVHMASAASGDVSATLLDGKWHHVAAVLDRSRHGEIRLYLDGRNVTTEAGAQPYPVDAGRMSVALGAVSPAYIGRDGKQYRGGIDEVRISRVVRPEFVAAADAPPAPPLPKRRRPAEAALTPDSPESLGPLVLAPEATVIVTPDLLGTGDDRTAALLLQKWLRKATRSEAGFEVLGAQRPASLAGKIVLAVGRTEYISDEDLKGLEPDGYALRRKGNAIVLARGAASKAALWAAVGFLDRYCGVRFYLPGDLYTSVPQDPTITVQKIDVRVEPYVKAGAAHTWGAHLAAEWGEYYAFYRRPASHQHTMYERFPPEKFAAKYPKIYPIINAQRYLPQRGDQNWQPVFSEPTLVEAAVESAEEFFLQQPDCPYIAFSIQDARTYGEQDMQSDEVKKNGKQQGLSNLFWTFINETARRIERKHPGKQVLALAYSDVRTPPPLKLHKNVIVCTVFTMADIVIDDVFGDKTDQPAWAEQWATVASQVGQHDWSYGYGYLIPRLYTNLVQRTFLEFEKMDAPIRFAYWELGPNWGLDGPKLYLMARLWWDPHTDIKAGLACFCEDMFGPAAAEMNAYFTKLETLYFLMNKDAERKLFKWSNQFLQNAEQRALTAQCRGHLDKALALAAADETARQRIELFSKTFRYSEYLMEIANAKTVTQAQLDAVKSYAAEVIEPNPMTIHRGKDGVVKQLDQVLAVITKGKLCH